MSSTDESDLKQLLVGLDADARRRDLPGLLGGAPGGAESAGRSLNGTDPASSGDVPALFAQVVRKLTDRRRVSQWRLACGQFVRQHAGGPLDETAKEHLRRLQQQLAARHAP